MSGRANWCPSPPGRDAAQDPARHRRTRDHLERGRGAHQGLPPRGNPRAALLVFLSRGHVESEGLRVRKDGTQFWANAVITALRDEEGRLVGFTKVTRD